MPFAVAAAAVGAGATIYASQNASKAANKANQTQQAAQDSAEGRFQQTRGDLMPYMEAGTNALAPQQALMGLQGQEAADTAMGNFQQSPGYQYQLDEGMRAVQASGAAAGMRNSGATMKALQDRGNSLAAQDFGTYYNRLAGLAGLGQNSAAGVGSAGTQVSQMGNQTAAGQAQTGVSAASNQNSIYAQGAQGIGNAINQYGNNSMYAQQTNALYNAPGGGFYGQQGGIAPYQPGTQAMGPYA